MVSSLVLSLFSVYVRSCSVCACVSMYVLYTDVFRQRDQRGPLTGPDNPAMSLAPMGWCWAFIVIGIIQKKTSIENSDVPRNFVRFDGSRCFIMAIGWSG